MVGFSIGRTPDAICIRCRASLHNNSPVTPRHRDLDKLSRPRPVGGILRSSVDGNTRFNQHDLD
jgi:hypothetical protein